MLKTLFSFSGRISRMEFAGWSAIEACLSALLLVAVDTLSNDQLVALKQHGGFETDDLPRIAAVLMMGAAVVVLPASALMIKRLRDIGLPPWPCLFVISLVDTSIALVVPHTPDGYLDGPFAGFALNGIITVLLALMPSQRGGLGDERSAPSDDWVQRAAAAEAKFIEERARHQGLVERLQAEDAMRRDRRVAQRAFAVSSTPAFGRRRGDQR